MDRWMDGWMDGGICSGNKTNKETARESQVSPTTDFVQCYRNNYKDRIQHKNETDMSLH